MSVARKRPVIQTVKPGPFDFVPRTHRTMNDFFKKRRASEVNPNTGQDLMLVQHKPPKGPQFTESHDLNSNETLNSFTWKKNETLTIN